MSAIGTKRTSAFALQMSAFDPKRTLASPPLPHASLSRYDVRCLSLGGGHEAAGIYYAPRRRGSDMAARRTRNNWIACG